MRESLMLRPPSEMYAESVVYMYMFSSTTRGPLAQYFSNHVLDSNAA